MVSLSRVIWYNVRFLVIMQINTTTIQTTTNNTLIGHSEGTQSRIDRAPVHPKHPFATFGRFIVRSFSYWIRSYQLMEQTSTAAQKRTGRLVAIRAGLKNSPLFGLRSEQLKNKSSPPRQPSKAETSPQEKTADARGREGESQVHEIRLDSGVSVNLFLEKYTLLQKIGEGCNSRVYKCLYKPTQKLYAVKIIQTQEQHILSLKKDFITLKELTHPAICRYKALYFVPKQRTAYLVLQYIPYPSLAQVTVTSEEELRIIVRELLSAIACLHGQNICHRDIKPENVLYDQKQRRLKLIDFGIAKRTFLRGVRREMLTVIGSPCYLAPQIYLGGGYDERVDLWALGITIYKLVAGCTPFESEYHSDTIANIIKDKVRFEEESWAKYSSKLQVLIGCLLKKVEERMTIRQAEQDGWLLESTTKKTKLRRMSSLILDVQDNFHAQISNKFRNAIPKEEGSQVEAKPIFKSIKSLNDNHYQLEDSDDEETLISPPAYTPHKHLQEQISGPTFGNFVSSREDSTLWLK